MKKFISKLTFTQAYIITVAISLLLSLASIPFVYSQYPNAFSTRLSLAILLCTSLVIFVYMVSYTLLGLVLFNLPEKQAKEEAIAKFNLTKEEYTQVDYDATTASKSLLPFLMIAHSEFYFYVKLTENEELTLLVKNSKQDVIYDNTIRFMYFNAHFKKIT